MTIDINLLALSGFISNYHHHQQHVHVQHVLVDTVCEVVVTTGGLVTPIQEQPVDMAAAAKAASFVGVVKGKGAGSGIAARLAGTARGSRGASVRFARLNWQKLQPLGSTLANELFP